MYLSIANNKMKKEMYLEKYNPNTFLLWRKIYVTKRILSNTERII